MLVAQSPISGHQQPRSGRKPLQPKNCSPTPFDTKPKPNLNLSPAYWAESSIDRNNKENAPLIYSIPAKKESFAIESFDASLAEELTAIREKLERLRIDKEKTDKMLRERSLALDSRMKEVVDRGVLQKQLEIEVDRLFRLKEIKLSCTSLSSPLRSLREKEQAKKICLQQQDRQQELSQFKAENHAETQDDREEESAVGTNKS